LLFVVGGVVAVMMVVVVLFLLLLLLLLWLPVEFASCRVLSLLLAFLLLSS
jgi:hypothetical protein